MRRVIQSALHHDDAGIGTGPVPNHNMVYTLQALGLCSASQSDGLMLVTETRTVDAALGETPATLLVHLLVDTQKLVLKGGRPECRTMLAFDRGRERNLRRA